MKVKRQSNDYVGIKIDYTSERVEIKITFDLVYKMMRWALKLPSLQTIVTSANFSDGKRSSELVLLIKSVILLNGLSHMALPISIWTENVIVT